MSVVLVVHADSAVGAELARAITEAGHETRVATSGERAMDRFVQEPADVVVLDYDLHGRDGLKAAEAIRWMPGGRRARVVLTASRQPEGSTLEELGRGVDAFAVRVGALDVAALAAIVDRAAAVQPHEAETRVLTVEQALLAAERAREERATPLFRPSEVTVARGAIQEPPESPLLLDDNTLDEPQPADWEWRDTDGSAEGREVRQIAEEAERTGSDLVGSFEAIPFARLLHRMAQRRATGALICVHPPDERATTEGTEPTKVVYFRAGVPVHVRSNLVAECLGQVLVHQRRIGPATLRESLSAVHRGEGRQGEVLVAMGAIGPLELSEALAEQLRRKLFELFGWQRGTFRFASRSPPAELIDLGLGLAEITYLGVREGMAPARVIERLAAERESYVVPQPRELVRFVRLHVPEALRELVGAIDGSRTVRALLSMSSDRAGAAQLLYAMACLEAVRFQPVRDAQRPPVPDEPPQRELPQREPPQREPPRAELLHAEVSSALPATSPERPAPRGGSALPSDPPPHEPSQAAVEEPLESEASASAEGDAIEAGGEVLDARVERLLAAERHFRRGQRALDRGRSSEAVAALERAAELCPDEARFLVYLGWARHAAAPDDAFVLSEALDLAGRACALAPELSVAHLLRARLLGAAGQASEARAALDRVLELDPTNEEAAR